MQFHNSFKFAEKAELNFFHGHTYIQHLKYFGKRVIQTNPSKFDETLFSDIYLCRLRLKQGREIPDFDILRQGVPEKDMLVLNKSSLGLGTLKLFLELV